MTCASFGSFLSQLLCSASRVRASATDETSFSSKPAAPEGEHQGPVVVPCRLEPDRDRQIESPQDIDQASIIVARVQHGHPAAACLAGDCDQHLVAVLGNVDAYQNTGIRSMLSLGHSRSPLWCGSQNHHRDPRPGYGRPLRDLRAAQAAITSQRRILPNMLRPGVHRQGGAGVDRRRRRKDRLHRAGSAPGRTATARASTPSSATSCSTGRSSTASPRRRSSSKAGAATTTPSARTHHWGIDRRLPRSSSGRLRHPEPLRRPPRP